jgi:hypothetical protein
MQSFESAILHKAALYASNIGELAFSHLRLGRVVCSSPGRSTGEVFEYLRAAPIFASKLTGGTENGHFMRLLTRSLPTTAQRQRLRSTC